MARIVAAITRPGTDMRFQMMTTGTDQAKKNSNRGKSQPDGKREAHQQKMSTGIGATNKVATITRPMLRTVSNELTRHARAG